MDPTLLLALALSVLASLVCALYIRFSGPIVAVQRLRDMEDEFEALRLDWARAKQGFQSLADQIVEDVEKVERLRKRVAAQRSRERPINGEEHQVVGPDGQILTGENAAAYIRAKNAGLL